MKRKKTSVSYTFFQTEATNISGSLHIHNSTLVCGKQLGIHTDTDESVINASDLDQLHSLRTLAQTIATITARMPPTKICQL